MSDSEHEVVERQVGKGFQPSFTLDDAFSDGEDGDSNIEFSSAALRKHLTENPSWVEKDDREDEGETDYASAHDLDTSISTFCLDGSSNSHPESGSSSPSPPAPPETEQEQEVLQDFSDITLSGELTTHGHSTSHADIQVEVSSPLRETSQDPAIHIDASGSTPNGVTTIIGVENDVEEQHEHEAVYPIPNTSSSHLPAPSHDLPPLPPSPSSPLPRSPTMSRPKARSAGPSAFQQVLSKTRPHFLPPKSREEDRKHLADWEAMMRESRAAGDLLVTFIVAVC